VEQPATGNAVAMHCNFELTRELKHTDPGAVVSRSRMAARVTGAIAN
jgi:hypothetical protein